MKDLNLDVKSSSEKIINKADELIENSKEKIELIREKLSDSFEEKVGEAADWTKANPYKATSIGLLGILSLKSKTARSIAIFLAGSIGTSYLLDKVEKNKAASNIND